MPEPSPTISPPAWWLIGESSSGGELAAVPFADDGSAGEAVAFSTSELAPFVTAQEADGTPRWVWSDTPRWYPGLLAAGIRIERCHDLRLCHAILARSERVPDPAPLLASPEWSAESAPPAPTVEDTALFDIGVARDPARGVPHGLAAGLAEFARQRAALSAVSDRGALRLLLSAESAGALVAVEMTSAGVPWDAVEHDRLLKAELGPRPVPGAKPERMIELAGEIRAALDDPSANLDSPPKLVRSLRRAGIDVDSTSRWELAEHEHPAIAPLLRYKKLARLLAANGWTWLDEWVHDGRYHPVYVPGGVVTGRWASSGGGALQLPRQLRPALRADPGWVLVSADVAQLEPRALAAMSGDRALTSAARGTDLYAGIVATGAVATREEAKFAVLGALYGATTGESGRLAPRLRRSYPAAMRAVDSAAITGEHGGRVSTWLGRTSPLPDEAWREQQARASMPGATPRDEANARRSARDFGRFTRNFVVQGTAAEWALSWMAILRQQLFALPELESSGPQRSARASGPVFERRPHLVFFLHDEVIVHAPEAQAEAVSSAIRASAAQAGALLFPGAPIDFPLDLNVGQRASAK